MVGWSGKDTRGPPAPRHTHRPSVRFCSYQPIDCKAQLHSQSYDSVIHVPSIPQPPLLANEMRHSKQQRSIVRTNKPNELRQPVQVEVQVPMYLLKQ